MNDRAVPIALTLYPEDLDLLDRIGEEHGLRSRSAVARYIFNDWPRIKRAALIAATPGDCSPQAGCDCPPDPDETPRTAAYRQIYTAQAA